MMNEYKVRLADEREFGPAPMDMLLDWARQGRIPADALLVPIDDGPVRSVLAEPALRAIIQPPANHPPMAPQATAPEQYSGMIPYRNQPALFAYYLGLFSLLPMIGFALAVPAVVLGIIGLRKRSKHPEVKGSVHAWIGIVMGSIFTLIWGAFILLFLVPTRIS